MKKVSMLLVCLGMSIIAVQADLIDDFQDGDYTNSPVWTVNSGTWSVIAEPGDVGNNVLNRAARAGGDNTEDSIYTDIDEASDWSVTVRGSLANGYSSANSVLRIYVGTADQYDLYGLQVSDNRYAEIRKDDVRIGGSYDTGITWETGVHWYEVTFSYDSSAGDLSAVISDIDGVFADKTFSRADASYTSFSRLTIETKGSAARYFDDVQFTAVPEPATLGIFGLGVVSLLLFRRMRSV